MTTIFIARHGETVWHAENRYAGVSDIPLTEHGLQQARALAAWAKDANLDAVYSSPLIRGTTTAGAAADAANVQLSIDARLMEIDWGQGEGLTRDEMATAFPAAYESFVANPASSPLPDGESGQAAIERVMPALDEIVLRYPAGRVLVVGHSTLTRLIVATITGTDLDRYRSTMPHVGNCTLTILRFSPTGTALLGFNLPTSYPWPMSTGSELWQKAKTLIPGGSMLLSKRAEMYLPAGWPAYFSRTSGCTVWDLDDRAYLDVGLMGVGTNILGYSHPKVDEAVRRTIDSGNLSTLNAPEEVYLAEALIALHPWAGMARFTRSGGEACAVAVRIARAASGKDKVAFCGYHGWHDWYLSANLGEDDSLDGHLLPGLEPNGVPRALRGSSIPFRFNDLEGLTEIMQDDAVGVIFMEVQRSDPPAPGFLEAVRALATKHGAVLVFDECTSGFRRALGGMHLHYSVDPDIATFGKTLGNGYAINAIIGRAEVMQAAQTTFISSTFWTERIGPTAALATLKVMADEDAPARVHAIGEAVQQRWLDTAQAAGLEISVGGLPALANYSVVGLDPLLVKTYVTGRLLDEGFLGGLSVYASIAHTEQVLDQYFTAVSKVMIELAQLDDAGLRQLLPDGTAHGGFARLT